MNVEYPTRCRIVDVTRRKLHGVELRTPDVSRPHIGKEGLADREDGRVKIALDDGTTIYGDECWWVPLES